MRDSMNRLKEQVERLPSPAPDFHAIHKRGKLLRWRHRAVASLGAASVIIALGSAAMFALSFDRSDQGDHSSPIQQPPSGPALEAEIDVPGLAPGAVVAGGASAWVANGDGLQPRLWRLRGEAGEADALASVPPGVVDMAFDGSDLWVATAGFGTVERFDAETGQSRGSVAVGERLIALDTGGGSLWVLLNDPPSVWQIDLETGRILGEPMAVSSSPGDLAFDDGVVWVTGPNQITRLDVRNREVISRAIPLGGYAGNVAADDHAVWVSGEKGVMRIDSQSGKRIGELVTTPGVAGDLIVSEGAVWVLSETRLEPDAGYLTKLDASSGKVLSDPLRLPHRPAQIAIGARIWVSSLSDGLVMRIRA